MRPNSFGKLKARHTQRGRERDRERTNGEKLKITCNISTIFHTHPHKTAKRPHESVFSSKITYGYDFYSTKSDICSQLLNRSMPFNLKEVCRLKKVFCTKNNKRQRQISHNTLFFVFFFVLLSM